jgi:hypothetical protein
MLSPDVCVKLLFRLKQCSAYYFTQIQSLQNFLPTPRQKPRRGGGFKQINSLPQIPFTVLEFLNNLWGLGTEVVVPARQSRKLKSRYGARNRFQEPSLELSSQAT